MKEEIILTDLGITTPELIELFTELLTKDSTVNKDDFRIFTKGVLEALYFVYKKKSEG